ncbi:uncharacterized protein L203_100065 [Cryptococcus depauperatus CBS 7841]|uniref:Zn(2)-C6 fungal-type domain-containing protein n=1 Tax=Cryptococcus depauperatus CBS 7841 TaxID=1295531 RepID=A0AAJ8JMD1_9TREE
METPYEAHNHPPPPPRQSSLASAKKGKQKRSSFSSEHNPGSTVRAFSACKNCRNKKIKCQPGLPLSGVGTPSIHPRSPSSLENPGANLSACQQCVQAGLECTYPPTRDRAAYSRQYVANLEARVQSLEILQARIIPMLEAYEAGSEDDIKPVPFDLPTRALPNPAKGLEGENEVGPPSDEPSNSEVEDAGQITQDDRGNYRWIGSSNTLSLLDSFSGRPPSRSVAPHTQSTQTEPAICDVSTLDKPARDNNPYFGPVAGSGVVKALPDINEVQYPTKEKALEMIDAFFSEVHPCLPVVLEHDFRRNFWSLLQAREKGDLSWGGGFISVVFAIFALGERAIVTSRAWQRETENAKAGEVKTETVLPGEAEAGVIWYERAQILHYTTLKDVNIHQVQCLTLLAAFQASVSAMPMSWLLAGQAIRVAQDLGLHRSTARLPISFQEKQLRSRCWWAIYGLERMMSIFLGRPLGVDDLDVDVAYPVEVDDAALAKMEATAIQTPTDLEKEPEASTMSGFVALTKLCKIAGRVVHLLYRPSGGRSMNDQGWAMVQQNAINKMDMLLRDWLENDVPSKYKDPSESHSISLLSAILSNSYFTILITLHRNFLPSSPFYPRPKPPPSSQSLTHCIDAARSVIHIASQSRTLIPPSHHLAVYCQYLWSSAVILLLCEVQAREQVVIEAVGSQVEACRRCLQALEPVWPGAKKMKKLLNDVASRAKEVVVDPNVSSKKRKLHREKDKASMAPPFHGPQPHPSTSSPTLHQTQQGWHPNPHSQAQGHSHSSSLPPPDKRQRLYEVSDTRTTPQDDDVFVSSQSTPQTAYYPVYPISTPTDGPSRPLSLANNPQIRGDLPMYETFDFGGVNFEGLELLQGFGGGVSQFWNSLNYMDGGSTTAGNAGTRGTGGYTSANLSAGSSAPVTSTSSQFFSEQLTPTSGGPSPGSWQGLNTGLNNGSATQGQGGYQQDGIANVGPGVAAFWEQVVGGTFDWQADPNVPFNI